MKVMIALAVMTGLFGSAAFASTTCENVSYSVTAPAPQFVNFEIVGDFAATVSFYNLIAAGGTQMRGSYLFKSVKKTSSGFELTDADGQSGVQPNYSKKIEISSTAGKVTVTAADGSVVTFAACNTQAD